MVDLEKIKREVRDVCNSIDVAFIALSDKHKEHEEAEKQISRLKGEIVLFEERKANAAVSARDEEAAASNEKKKYTEEKVKYRKLTDEIHLTHAQVLGEQQVELDSMRTRELSLLKADKGKVATETDMMAHERDAIKKEYLDFKNKLIELKKGIVV